MEELSKRTVPLRNPTCKNGADTKLFWQIFFSSPNFQTKIMLPKSTCTQTKSKRISGVDLSLFERVSESLRDSVWACQYAHQT